MRNTKILRNLAIGLFVVLISGSIFVSAQCSGSEIFRGNAFMGGVAGSAGTVVSVENANTGEVLGNCTTPFGGSLDSNYYSLTITVTDVTNSSDNKAEVGDPLAFKINGVACDSPVASTYSVTAPCTDPPGPPTTHTGVNLSLAASCSDLIQNQNETGVDCGGPCTACYDVSVSSSSVSVSVLPNASTTSALTITNVGYNDLTAVTLTTTGLPANITVAFSTNTFSLTGTGDGTTTAGGGQQSVTLNISVGTIASGIYSGTIIINSTQAASAQVTISVNTAATSEDTRRRARGYFIVNLSEPVVIGEPVTLTVMDKKTERMVSEVRVKIFFGSLKVDYGITDDDGIFQFTPTESGEYTIELYKTRYYDEVITLDTSEGATVTTTLPVTTTITPTTTTPPVVTTTPPATTIPPSTTTPPVVTTTPPVVTTTPPVVTTTVPSGGGGMGTYLIIGVVIVIIIVVIYFVTSKKGNDGGELGEESGAEEDLAEVEEEE